MTETIKARGTIKITNTDTGETTLGATYDAADVLKALNAGEPLKSIIARLENVQTVSSKPANTDPDPKDSFPFGM